MIFNTNYFYRQNFKGSAGEECFIVKEGFLRAEVKEVAKEEFPIAFITCKYQQFIDDAWHCREDMFAEEIRTYCGNYYRPVRKKFEGIIPTTEIVEAEKLKMVSPFFKRKFPYKVGHPEQYTKQSVHTSNTEKESREAVLAEASRWLILEGGIWEKCGEPMYYVQTFDFGNSYDGTYLLVGDCYNPFIPRSHYFAADKKTEAVLFAREEASKYGHTDSIKYMRKYAHIEICMPELVSRNPEKDPDDANRFLPPTTEIDHLIAEADFKEIEEIERKVGQKIRL